MSTESSYSFIDIIQKIPKEVWAAVAASIITLAGVFLNNITMLWQQKAARKHDEKQREKEREMSLKREIYLNAAEAVSNSLAALGRLANVEISNQEISNEIEKNGAAIAKVQIVGTNTTVQAIINFSAEFSNAYQELYLERFTLVTIKSSIHTIIKLSERYSVDCENWIELMKKYNLEGDTDQRKWDVISDNFNYSHEKNNELIKQQAELESKDAEQRFLFVKLLNEKIRTISSLIPPAIFAVRKELNLPLDEEAFLKVHNDALVKLQKVTENFLQKARQKIGSNLPQSSNIILDTNTPDNS